MTHGSLFSGIGGFELAAETVGWENAFSCEIDPFCNRVLKYHFPHETQYHDIRTTDFYVWRGRIDVLSGGFPCQPFSTAGKRLGTSDDRHLWPEMLRAIREIRPRWVVGENVLGILSWNGGMVFEQVCADLEAEGFEVRPFVLPAAGVGAPHQRYRVWFVAHATGDRDPGRPVEIRPPHGRPFGAVLPEPDQSGAVRRNVENSMCNGREHIEWQEEPREWQQRNVGAGNHERVCGEAGSDAHAVGRELTQRHEANGVQDRAETGAGLDGGVERYGHVGPVADADIAGFQAQGTEKPPTGFAGVPERVAADTDYEQLQRRHGEGADGRREPPLGAESSCGAGIWDFFPTFSPVCRADDGFSALLDADAVFEGVRNSGRASAYNRWRQESVKAFGNAVVPPLVMQIFRAIDLFEKLCPGE